MNWKEIKKQAILKELDKFLEKTGYSTINENIAEAEKILEEEMDDIEKEEMDINNVVKEVEKKPAKKKITSKPVKKKK